MPMAPGRALSAYACVLDTVHPRNPRDWLSHFFRFAIITFCIFLPFQSYADVHYDYDAAGRLTGVTASDGESATYSYDAAGNIIAINRYVAGALRLSSVSPTRGLVGAQVTIRGGGFSTVATNNTVQFNGVQAAITSATAETLVVNVPAGATSGLVSVTKGSETVSSTSPFTVVIPPTISSFTPASGTAGTAITISGSGFETIPQNNRVLFNNSIAMVTAATATQLQVTVPTNTASGPITVTTSNGSAISSDFLIPPGTLTITDIASTLRPTIDGVDQIMQFSTANKRALLYLPGGNGSLYSVHFSSPSFTGASYLWYTIYAPDNSTVLNQTLYATASSKSLHLPELTLPGTYTIAFYPATNGTGSVNYHVETNDVLQADQAPLSGAVTVSGQTKRYVIPAVSGDNLGIALTDLVLTPSSVTTTAIYVDSPDGTGVASGASCAATGSTYYCALNLKDLASTGNYTVVVIPAASATSTYKLWLSEDVTGLLQPSVPFMLDLSRPGQNAQLRFSGEEGHLGALELADVNVSIASVGVTGTILTPTGSTFSSVSATTTSAGSTVVMPPMPADGQYTVFVETNWVATATMQITDEPGTDITAGPAAINGSFGVRGESVVYRFTADAGANMGIALTNDALNPATGNNLSFQVFKPDGASLILSPTCSGISYYCSLNLTNLPVTGTYRVLIKPTAASTGTFSLWLTNDRNSTLTPNVDSSFAVDSAGQNLWYTFNGTAGTQYALDISDYSASPSNQSVLATVIKPDGSTLTTLSSSYSGASKLLPPLPVDGQYKIFLENQGNATATGKITLKSGAAVSISSGSINGVVTNAGGSALYSFEGVAGQNLGLALTDAVFIPSSPYAGTVTVYKPDGSTLDTLSSCDVDGLYCTLNMTNLPASGTYRILVKPAASATGTFKLWLTEDITDTLTPNSGYALSLLAGQNAWLSYNGTSGESLAVELASFTSPISNQSITLKVLKPDGSTLTTWTGGNSTNVLAPLPVSGTYKIFVDQLRAASSSQSITVKTGSSVTVGATPTTTSVTLPGASAVFNFQGTAGQNLGIALSDVALTPSNIYNVVYTVYKPDGTSLTSATCSASNGSNCSLDLTLTQTGTHLVVVLPASNATATFKIWITSNLTDVLSTDTPYVLNNDKPGQNITLNFSGTAGQLLALEVAAYSSTPSGKSVSVVMKKPDGSTFKSVTTSTSNLTLLSALPVTGTYTLFVSQTDNALATMTLTMKSGVTLTPDVGSVSENISTSGARAVYNFNGTAGQNLGFALSDLALTPSSVTTATMMVYKPDASLLSSSSCTANSSSSCAMNLSALPTAGMYRIVIQPASNATATFLTWLTTDKTGSLVASTPYSLALDKPGQNATLTFSGTAGQTPTINVTGVSTTPSGKNISFVAKKPDGTTLTSWGVTSSGYAKVLASLPTTGTYSLFVEVASSSNATANMTVTLQ